MQNDGSASLEPTKARLSWRERRWERRRKRQVFEEFLGWVLVPVIVVGCYFGAVAVLGALGTSPAAVVEALGQLRR
jgi:hypothetical protein